MDRKLGSGERLEVFFTLVGDPGSSLHGFQAALPHDP